MLKPQANAIAGARNADQATANAQAGEVKLSQEELAEIDAIASHVTDHLDDSPMMWDW